MKLSITICSVLTIFLLISCCKPPNEKFPADCTHEAVILSQDERRCACCGGWFIEIEGDTLRAPVLPQPFAQSLDTNEFPLPILLEWDPAVNPCLGDEIEVFCIRRQ